MIENEGAPLAMPEVLPRGQLYVKSSGSSAVRVTYCVDPAESVGLRDAPRVSVLMQW